MNRLIFHVAVSAFAAIGISEAFEIDSLVITAINMLLIVVWLARDCENR
jgi:hypothetical protein